MTGASATNTIISITVITVTTIILKRNMKYHGYSKERDQISLGQVENVRKMVKIPLFRDVFSSTWKKYFQQLHIK